MTKAALHLTLDAFKARFAGVKFSAEDLVERFGDQIELYAPCFKDSKERDFAKKELKERMVRHYVSEGLISPPVKDRGENRYNLRHLLELLTLRKLQADGEMTLTGMRGLLPDWSLDYMHHVLMSGAQVHVAAAEPPEGMETRGNPAALKLVAEIQQSAASIGRPQSLRLGSAGPPRQWHEHHLIAPGLELVMAENFERPDSPQAERLLIERILGCLRRSGRHTS